MPIQTFDPPALQEAKDYTDAEIAALPSASAPIPCDDIVTILASGTAGEFERCPTVPSVVQLAAATAFPTIADAKTSPPNGWINENAAQISSASSSSSGRVITAATGTTTMNADAMTCGVQTQTFTSTPEWVEGVYRIGAVLASHDHDAPIGFMVGAGNTIALIAKLYRASGSVYWVSLVHSSASYVGVVTTTSAVLAAGVWFRIRWWAGRMMVQYSLQNVATEAEVTWVSALAWTASTHIPGRVVHGVNTPTVSAAGSSSTLIYARTSCGNLSGFVTPPTSLNAAGFTAAPTAVSLVVADFGSAVTPSISALRLALADAINRLPGDAGTWTFSITGSADPAPTAATTYQSAAAVVLKDEGSDTAASSAYRYWTLRAKATSASGAQPGSIDTALIRLVV